MTAELKAEVRDGTAAAARRAGKIPGVLYGRSTAAVAISLDVKTFMKIFEEAGESTVIELTGLSDLYDVLIKEVAYDPVSDVPLHVDLYAVEKGQKVTVAVPIEFEGVSPAVKDLGGMLVKVLHELEVEGDPKNLPHEIVIDISRLATLDDKLIVADIVLPSGVTTENNPEDVVALIDVAKEEVEETPADISQIEVSVEKGKKEEEEASAE
ncbi:MAG: 50S ribosomal protein L25 [Terriglobia bacterium]